MSNKPNDSDTPPTADCHPRLVSHSDAVILTKMLGAEANEIASWYDSNRDGLPRMVALACRNEMSKLRALADKLKALLPDCPECGKRLETYDEQSFECPEECGFFHKDSLANACLSHGDGSATPTPEKS